MNCRDRHADERPYEWLTFSEHSKDFENVLFQDIGNSCLKASETGVSRDRKPGWAVRLSGVEGQADHHRCCRRGPYPG
jgi:hypothetical protein